MAGTWEVVSERVGDLAGQRNTPRGVARKYTSDVDDGSVPDGSIEGIAGSIMAMDVEFDDTDPPDGCTVTIKTAAGIELLTSGAIAVSSRTYPNDGMIPVAGDLVISVSNTGNSKIATVVLLMV